MNLMIQDIGGIGEKENQMMVIEGCRLWYPRQQLTGVSVGQGRTESVW